MPKPPDAVSCSWVDDRLEAMADGDLAGGDRSLLSAHAAICARCAEELSIAIEIRSGLRGLGELRCPPRVAERVFDSITAEGGRPAEDLSAAAAGAPPDTAGVGRWRSLFSPMLQPAFAAALAVAIVVAGTVWLNRPAATPEMTPEEVERTKLELQLTFAYIGQIGQSAGTSVRQEVVDNVVVPTQRALFAPPMPGQEDLEP